MNYAEDRLDRRAWQQDVSLLTHEFQSCWDSGNHAGIARLCLSLGWNRHAVYHYAVCWMSDPSNEQAAADYAQMADLAGFSEVGILAILVFRLKGLLLSQQIQPCIRLNDVPIGHFQASASEMNGVNCGCGNALCGAFSCFVPMDDDSILAVFSSLSDYSSRLSLISQRQSRQRTCGNDECNSTRFGSIPNAHEVLRMIAERIPFDLSDRAPEIPKLLQFWNRERAQETCTSSGSDTLRALSPAIQLLLVKLFFLVLPTLAIEAVVYVRFDNSKNPSDSLAVNYKSHWAYFVFIQSLALGERIKPGRRRMLKFYHIPLWNRLWGIDFDENTSFDKRAQSSQAELSLRPEEFLSGLERLMLAVRDQSREHIATSRVSRVWIPLQCKLDSPPLFLVGDSHVLSLAWQTLQIRTKCDEEESYSFRLVVPLLTTGIKAWHFRSCTRFFTNSCLQTTLFHRIPSHIQTVLVSAGEIDCREGIGGQLLEGYTQACHDHIRRTVTAYVQALVDLLVNPKIWLQQVLVLPVAPHLQRSKGRVVGQTSRRETMQVWNNELRQQLPIRMEREEKGVYFLDFAQQLQVDDGSFALHPVFNADSTHMNSAFAPLLEKAMVDCGCNTKQL